MPTLMESIMSTFQIMQTSIVEHKLRISQPDIYVKPELKNIKALEFYRYAEIMNGVKNDVKHFKDEVSKWIKRPLRIL
jgi:NTE family protein